MRFARVVFWLAGFYGVVLLIPLYFLADQVGSEHPPPLTHLEFYYGFVGVSLAWHIMFLIIGIDPVRYRWAMLVAVFQKLSFATSTICLYLQEHVSGTPLGVALVDVLMAILFLIAFWMTPSE